MIAIDFEHFFFSNDQLNDREQIFDALMTVVSRVLIVSANFDFVLWSDFGRFLGLDR